MGKYEIWMGWTKYKPTQLTNFIHSFLADVGPSNNHNDDEMMIMNVIEDEDEDD